MIPSAESSLPAGRAPLRIGPDTSTLRRIEYARGGPLNEPIACRPIARSRNSFIRAACDVGGCAAGLVRQNVILTAARQQLPRYQNGHLPFWGRGAGSDAR